MKISEFFGRFVFTRKCPSCGELLPYEMSKEAFCDECRRQWDVEKTYECKICMKAVCECICMPKILASSGALCHHKVLKYSEKSSVSRRTVLFLKKNKNPRITGFLASQMCCVLYSDHDIPLLDADSSVVTFVPRSKKAVLVHGFDQSELLSKEIAKQMEIPWSITVLRNRKGREQKKLNAKQRLQNSKKLFKPSRDIDGIVAGKNVILVDDVVTTGASMAACVSYIVRARAKSVICLSVATTES